jgi:hypothetical protein
MWRLRKLLILVAIGLLQMDLFLNTGQQKVMSWIRHLCKLLFRMNLLAREKEEWWCEYDVPMVLMVGKMLTLIFF